MSLPVLLILAIAAVALQFILIAISRPKMHITLFTFVGLLPGIAGMIVHYFIYDEFSFRPLLKSFITAGMISCVMQAVFSTLKIFKHRDKRNALRKYNV